VEHLTGEPSSFHEIKSELVALTRKLLRPLQQQMICFARTTTHIPATATKKWATNQRGLEKIRYFSKHDEVANMNVHLHVQ